MASSIFNTDQGSRFTSEAFAEELKAKIIQIGIDERGREADNIPVGLVWCSAGDDRANEMVCFIIMPIGTPVSELKTPDQVCPTVTGGGDCVVEYSATNGTIPRRNGAAPIRCMLMDNPLNSEENCLDRGAHYSLRWGGT